MAQLPAVQIVQHESSEETIIIHKQRMTAAPPQLHLTLILIKYSMSDIQLYFPLTSQPCSVSERPCQPPTHVSYTKHVLTVYVWLLSLFFSVVMNLLIKVTLTLPGPLTYGGLNRTLIHCVSFTFLFTIKLFFILQVLLVFWPHLGFENLIHCKLQRALNSTISLEHLLHNLVTLTCKETLYKNLGFRPLLFKMY